ncbi:MAG: HAD-IA family hydrolase [Bryobacterales bacterium]|nr:HAD-IA family hydrolase [Bryobacterales bacterium]
MIPPFPVYLFDVDGTLVDSAADICGAVREALADTRAREVDEAYLRRYIGYHLFDLFEDLIPDVTEQEKQDLLAKYRTIYLGRGHSSTKVYPGVREAMARIGGRKSTATTKSTTTVRSVLELFGLLPHFDHVQGTDGFPAKPAPDVIQKSLEVFGVSPDRVLMIGDAATDMAAGRAAGVKICAVSWGYGNHAEMAAYQPDYWIEDLAALAG